ncbi:MAG: 3-hydroxyacyl-CoA dehydrogenase [Pseudonocardia sp.]|nr:3-hydroxyacyl-CoA dehydrogenase [Pseudonocardia sp.]
MPITAATATADLPSPASIAARLAESIFEVLAGRRSLQQLMPHTSDTVYAQLTIGVYRAGRRPRHLPGPLVATAHGRPVVVLDEPADGVVEAAVVIRRGDRARAVALRLEGLDGRWRCTALELL